MRTQSYGLKIFVTMSALTWLLIGCGSDRVNIEFKTPPQLYSDDSKTDPDKLNRELEYDLREAEKKRRQKEREAEAAKAKAEADQKARGGQKMEDGVSGNKTIAP
ncbi:MAG: hypothetical protein AABZ13_05235 [Planctomycetota bacterium]